MVKKKDIKNPALKSWVALNLILREASEITCRDLFKEETAGRARRRFLLRIHSRLNKVRADKERLALKVTP